MQHLAICHSAIVSICSRTCHFSKKSGGGCGHYPHARVSRESERRTSPFRHWITFTVFRVLCSHLTPRTGAIGCKYTAVETVLSNERKKSNGGYVLYYHLCGLYPVTLSLGIRPRSRTGGSGPQVKAYVRPSIDGSFGVEQNHKDSHIGSRASPVFVELGDKITRPLQSSRKIHVTCCKMQTDA